MEHYYLVHRDILPEALLKTIQAKQLLASGEAKTINEAAEKVELSRSAFYKYKDGIHTLQQLGRERIVIVSMDLQHQSGMLSRVLSLVAEHGGNILTINQTIPLQGMANVVLTIDMSGTDSETLESLIETLNAQQGVRRASVIGTG